MLIAATLGDQGEDRVLALGERLLVIGGATTDRDLLHQFGGNAGGERSLTALRRRYPILRRNRFLSTVVNEAIGVKEVSWIHVSGAEMRDEDWSDAAVPCFGMLLDGRAQVTGIKQRGQDATLLLIVNSHHDGVDFTLPAAGDDLALARWTLLLDTQFAAPAHTADNEYAAGDVYLVTGRSLLLLKLKLPPEAPLWSEQR